MAEKPEKRYNVIFSGRMVEGKEPPEILAGLCRFLELEEPAVRELFAVVGSVIKSDLEGQKAYSVRDSLRDAGVICTVQEIIPPPESAGELHGLTPGVQTPRRTTGQGAPSHLRPVQRPLAAERQPASSGGSSGLFSFLSKLIIFAVISAAGWWVYQASLTPPSP
jgi:hypothetical protein